ncbi:MAG: ABC transporter substrate-binding protein [Anaerolineae bacterium]
MGHRTLTRRSFLHLGAGAAAGAALAACTPPETVVERVVTQIVKETVVVEGTPQIIEKVVTAPPVKAPEQRITLQFWSYPIGFPASMPHGQQEQKWGDAFEEQYPNVQVQYRALGWDAIPTVQVAITSGNPPNVILRQSVDSVIQALEGDTAIEFDLPQELIDDLPAGWAEGIKYRGKNYMVPFYGLAAGMVLNLTLVEHFGAQDLAPKGPNYTWTFDEYLALMKACTSKGGGPGGKDTFGAFWAASQSTPFYYWPEQVLMWGWGADDVAYSDAEWRCKLSEQVSQDFLQWWQDCYTKHSICPNPVDTQLSRWDLWGANQLLSGIGPDIGWSRWPGMTVDPDTLVVTSREQGFTWRYVCCPTANAVPNGRVWGGPWLDLNAMPFKTKYANEIQPSIAFCLFLCNPENQKWLSQYVLPIRLSATQNVDDPMLKWHQENWIPHGRQRAAAAGGQAKAVCEALQKVVERLFVPSPVAEALDGFCDTIMALPWI